MKFKILVPSIIIFSIFIAGVLWRVDQVLYSDKNQWLEFQQKTQVGSIQQNYQALMLQWQNLPSKELRYVTGWQASFEAGKADETFQWLDSAWGPKTTKDWLLRKVKSLNPTLSAGQNISVLSFQDADQKNRTLVFLRQGKTLQGILISSDQWQSWVESFQMAGFELIVLNSEGFVFSHQHREYLGQRMADHPAFRELQSHPELNQWIKVASLPDSKKYSFIAERIPGTNLLVISAGSLDSVLQSRGPLRWQILILGAGVLLLLIGLIMLGPRTGEKIKSVSKNESSQVPVKTSNEVLAAALATGAEEKMKIYKSIASSLGHELRGPLASILASAQTIPQEALGTESQKQMNLILRETRYVREILEKILGFSGQAMNEKIEMKLETPIRKVLKKLESYLASKNVQIHVQIEGHKLFLISQEALMKAIENIILNACEAMDRQLQKKLDIRVSENEQFTSLVIQDQGLGMDEETLQKARDPFFTTRSFAHHLGLGLSEADGIFKEHGAEMIVTSEKGKGTKVEVRFDLSKNSQAQRGHENSAHNTSAITELKLPPLPDHSEIPAQSLEKTSTPTPVGKPVSAASSLTPNFLKPPADLFKKSEPPTPPPVSVSQQASTMAPTEPEGIEDLLNMDLDSEMPPVPEGTMSRIVQNQSEPTVKISSEEISLRLENLTEESLEMAPKSTLIPPQFELKKNKSALDEYVVKIKKPGEKSI